MYDITYYEYGLIRKQIEMTDAGQNLRSMNVARDKLKSKECVKF